MKINHTEIVDTFAEAFKMVGSRIIITAETEEWAMAAAQAATGFATSMIGCKCEAGIESLLPAEQSPDLRPGISILLFAMDTQSLGKRLIERISQCVMTTPTTACYNGLDEGDTVVVGGQLRYFGDGYQISKILGNTKMWRIPVMDGEFLVDDKFNVIESIGGGNLLILGEDQKSALTAATNATKAMRKLPDIILPFPNGVVRSGSKVSSRYKSLIASTNELYCPTLRGTVEKTELDNNTNCVLEIVVDGLSLTAIENAMYAGLNAAALPGIRKISAGNYDGNLGQYKLQLHKILKDTR